MTRPQTGHEAVDALLYAAHRVRNAADARLRECGLSLQGYKLMRALESSDLSMREISEALHISPRTVTDITDGLEARGLVTRRPHQVDRRVTHVHLTDTGRGQLAIAAAGAEQSARAAVANLTATEQRTLRGLLDRVAPAGEAHDGERPKAVGA